MIQYLSKNYENKTILRVIICIPRNLVKLKGKVKFMYI